MNKILMAGLVAFSMNSFADDSNYVQCSAVSDYGQLIMKARQIGVPLKDVLSAMDDTPSKNLAHYVYDHTPQYTTQAEKDDVIEEFGQAVLDACMEGEL